MSEPFDPEFGPGVRTVRHNPTVRASEGALAAVLTVLAHAAARLRAAWDALCAPEVAADLSDDVPPTTTDA